MKPGNRKHIYCNTQSTKNCPIKVYFKLVLKFKITGLNYTFIVSIRHLRVACMFSDWFVSSCDATVLGITPLISQNNKVQSALQSL